MKKHIYPICFLFCISFLLKAEKPVNPNANENTHVVLQFLKAMQGKAVLSGQENLATDVTKWTDIVKDKTGKYPAIIGKTGVMGRMHTKSETTS
jgi:hypothetical protein